MIANLIATLPNYLNSRDVIKKYKRAELVAVKSWQGACLKACIATRTLGVYIVSAMQLDYICLLQPSTYTNIWHKSVKIMSSNF